MLNSDICKWIEDVNEHAQCARYTSKHKTGAILILRKQPQQNVFENKPTSSDEESQPISMESSLHDFTRKQCSSEFRGNFISKKRVTMRPKRAIKTSSTSINNNIGRRNHSSKVTSNRNNSGLSISGQVAINKHATKRSLPRYTCFGCNQSITDKYLLNACDKFWHENCLKCDRCQTRLGELGSTLYRKSDMNLCRQDYLEMFGQTSICAVCDKLIFASEMVMRARQNVYHLECFACQLCGQRFCVGDRFYLFENKIVCQFDYEEHILPIQKSLFNDYATDGPPTQSSHEVNCQMSSSTGTSAASSIMGQIDPREAVVVVATAGVALNRKPEVATTICIPYEAMDQTITIAALSDDHTDDHSKVDTKMGAIQDEDQRTKMDHDDPEAEVEAQESVEHEKRESIQNGSRSENLHQLQSGQVIIKDTAEIEHNNAARSEDLSDDTPTNTAISVTGSMIPEDTTKSKSPAESS